MSLTHLTDQLTQLSDSLKTTNTLIARLSTLPFQPGTESLDSSAENDTVRVELAQDIHDSLRQLEEDLELLRQEAEDYTVVPGSAQNSTRRRESERDRERTRVSAGVVKLGDDLGRCRGRFRRAVLGAKRRSEEAKTREREVVFQSLTTVPESTSERTATPQDLFAGRSRKQKQKAGSKDEQLVDASSDVTAALRRTHSLLSTELSRSRFAQETFEESTAALADLGEHYTGLDAILTNSRNLLGTLVRSQKSDTWYLETAFYLLLVTLGWLVFRRILYGPFVRLPLFFWNLGALLLRWVVLKPLWLLLTITGIITTESVSATGARSSKYAISSSSRAPLIVHRSATGGIPTLAMSEREALQSGAGVPAGAGGAGAKVGKDGEMKMSEEIGQRHEESEKVRRGDGTVLEERGEVPRNPKKKAFDVEAEDEKQKQRERDEL